MRALKEQLFLWWRSISLREQRMIAICLLLTAVGGVYWGLIQPLSERATVAHTRINSEKQLLDWVSSKADHIVKLRENGGVIVSNQPFNQVISKSTQEYRIELIRIQPRDDMLQVWVKPVTFDQFVHWIAYLRQSHGVQIEFMELSQGETKGMVDVKRLQLKRGG